MKKNNIIRNRKRKRHSFSKRLWSIAIASTLFITSMPNVLFENIPSLNLKAHAANKDEFDADQFKEQHPDINEASDGVEDDKYSISGPNDLVNYSKYCAAYPDSHQK